MSDREAFARLRDIEAIPGSVEAGGIALLRQRARHQPAPASKARVRAALEARAGGSGAWRWRPVVVAAILLIGAAGSSSSFGRQWAGAGYHRLLTLMTPTPILPPTAARPRQDGVPARAAEAPSEAVAPSPAEVAPAVVPARAPRPERAPHRAPAAVLPRQEPKGDPTGEPRDEPTMVATAMRVLRRDHDPTSAARLLDDYLARWPEGALVEEALALRIEAARARGDARAPALAAEYLRRFPSGRFADAARRALMARSTP